MKTLKAEHLAKSYGGREVVKDVSIHVESGQIVGDQVLPFDDVEQASIAVAALDGRVA